MNCGKFLWTLVAFWALSAIGWITMTTNTPLIWTVLLVSVIVVICEFVFGWITILIKIVAMPLIIMTAGLLIPFLNAVFSYFFLYIAAMVTKLFDLPWIGGPQWIHALIIGVIFAVISGIGSGSTHRSSRSSYHES